MSNGWSYFEQLEVPSCISLGKAMHNCKCDGRYMTEV